MDSVQGIPSKNSRPVGGTGVPPVDSNLNGLGGPLYSAAWDLSRGAHGYELGVHTPGMFVVNGEKGRYPAVSITGAECALACEHCKGKLLQTMPAVIDQGDLTRLGLKSAARGEIGLLLTGGCNRAGRLPWKSILPEIELLKKQTELKISVHTGQLDLQTARDLKNAGVDQALIDVIGDDETARAIYRLKSASVIRQTLDNLTRAELEMIPHIIVGLYYGQIKGEPAALEIIAEYPINGYVVVVIMPLKGTPFEAIVPPPVEEVGLFLAKARHRLPCHYSALGCARPRGRYARALEIAAINAGVNAIAMPAEKSADYAGEMGLSVVRRESCCSLSFPKG
jgi:lipoyl synthase